MPNQHAKPSDSQRNFVHAKVQCIFIAIEEKHHGFDFQQLEGSGKNHFAEAVQMTMYLVDHPHEETT